LRFFALEVGVLAKFSPCGEMAAAAEVSLHKAFRGIFGGCENFCEIGLPKPK
jgi:hypothetical protein